MAGLMKQAQKMQEDMAKAQQEITEMEFTASAGGGAVSVTVSGEKLVKNILIDPDAFDKDDIEMLCDMLTAAFNEAIRQADDAVKEKMGAVTGGMGIPGF